MKPLIASVVLLIAVTAAAAPFSVDPSSSVPVLVPFSPSEQIDGYGARWSIALIGYNSSSSDFVVQCDRPPCPRFRANEAFSATGSLGASSEPMILRLPGDRVADIALEMSVKATNSASRSLRLPVVRLDAITERSLTFLNIDPDQAESRTSIRVYSPMWGGDERWVTMTIYREYEGRSAAIYSQAFKLNEVVSNGIPIGYVTLSWPGAVERTPFPTRVTIESDGPIWGFVTTSERSSEPAVALTLPAAK